jgi:hypothetical protein
MRAASNDRPSVEPLAQPAEAGIVPHRSIGRKTRKPRKESGKREEEYGVIAYNTPGVTPIICDGAQGLRVAVSSRKNASVTRFPDHVSCAAGIWS